MAAGVSCRGQRYMRMKHDKTPRHLMERDGVADVQLTLRSRSRCAESTGMATFGNLQKPLLFVIPAQAGIYFSGARLSGSIWQAYWVKHRSRHAPE